MSTATPKGKARMSATIERIPAAEAIPQPVSEPKTGTEVLTEKGYQHEEGADPVTFIRVVNHDTNRVLWSGTQAEYKALKGAIGKE